MTDYEPHLALAGQDFEPLKILKYPDPKLRTVCHPVEMDTTQQINDVIELFERMWVTLEEMMGYGLAAPQVGETIRMIIVHIPGGCKIEIVNPEIVKIGGGTFYSDEGCLSYPGRRVRVARKRMIKIKGLDRYGDPVSFGGKNLQAACLQHEMDHLDGINLADYEAKRIDKAT